MRPHPGVILIVSLVAAAALEAEVPASRDIPFAVRLGSAGILMSISAANLIWGLQTLNRANTPSEPNQEPRTIVTTGPFRYSRNPMYVSLLGCSIAWTCLVASAWFGVATVAVFLLLNFAVIPHEEAALKRNFPHVFAEWARHTRRWV